MEGPPTERPGAARRGATAALGPGAARRGASGARTMKATAAAEGPLAARRLAWGTRTVRATAAAAAVEHGALCRLALGASTVMATAAAAWHRGERGRGEGDGGGGSKVIDYELSKCEEKAKIRDNLPQNKFRLTLYYVFLFFYKK